MNTLQSRALSLANNLGLLAVSPGFVDIHEETAARGFYEKWAELNRECIAAGHENGGGDLSFVAGQLDRLLQNFPKGKTAIGILEVWPRDFYGSAFLFGSYINTLERIATTRI